MMNLDEFWLEMNSCIAGFLYIQSPALSTVPKCADGNSVVSNLPQEMNESWLSVKTTQVLPEELSVLQLLQETPVGEAHDDIRVIDGFYVKLCYTEVIIPENEECALVQS